MWKLKLLSKTLSQWSKTTIGNAHYKVKEWNKSYNILRMNILIMIGMILDLK